MESGEWRRQQLQERQRLLRERVEALQVDQLKGQEQGLFEQVEQLQSDVAQQHKQAAEQHEQVEQLVMDQRRHCKKVEAHLVGYPQPTSPRHRLRDRVRRGVPSFSAG
jgi:chromosome segregation ATPase